MSKDRRKAIDAKLIGESKTSPGYFKYQFTILELDGTTNVTPAYGKDMEDALGRLVWTERVEKKSFGVVIAVAVLTIILVPSSIAAITNNPIWVLYALVIAIIFGVTIVRIDKYFNKK